MAGPATTAMRPLTPAAVLGASPGVILAARAQSMPHRSLSWGAAPLGMERLPLLHQDVRSLFVRLDQDAK